MSSAIGNQTRILCGFLIVSTSFDHTMTIQKFTNFLKSKSYILKTVQMDRNGFDLQLLELVNSSSSNVLGINRIESFRIIKCLLHLY